MSVHCRIADVHGVYKALQTIAIAKDPWASCIFTQDVLVLHTVGDDQASTATATLPKSLFHEFIVTGQPQFVVHVGALLEALSMGGGGASMAAGGGGSAMYSGNVVKFLLAYPAADNRLLLEIAEGSRTLQSALVTRSMKERLLDLRFSDSVVVARTTLRGDAVVEFLNDLKAFGCGHVRLELSPVQIKFVGLQSVLGESVELCLGKLNESVLGLEVTDASVKPKYHAHHVLAACGLANTQRGSLAGAASSFAPTRGGASYGYGGGPTGFERLTLAINTERMLWVAHQSLDQASTAAVTVVISPVCDLDNL